MSLSLLLVAAVAAALPFSTLLVVGVPLLMVVGYAGIPTTVARLGTADLQLHDFLLGIVVARFCIHTVLRREVLRISPVYGALLLFAASLTAGTVAAAWRFGDDRFTEQIVPLLRLISQMLVVFIMAESVGGAVGVRRSLSMLRLLGHLGAASVYLAGLLYSLGYAFGEVQQSGSSLRLFGPVGDQIGFILLFFLFWEMSQGRIPHAAFLGGAILLTGTRGLLLSAAIGVTHLVVRRGQGVRPRRLGLVALAMSALMVVGLAVDVAGIRERSALDLIGEGSVAFRLAVQTIALRVFLDNPVLGVGFGGFRLIANDYAGGLPAVASGILALRSQSETTTNQFLQTATDAGLPGLLLLGWLLVVVTRTIVTAQRWTDRNSAPFLRAAHSWLVALALGNLFAVWIYPGSLITLQLWMITGVAVALHRLGHLSRLASTGGRAVG